MDCAGRCGWRGRGAGIRAARNSLTGFAGFKIPVPIHSDALSLLIVSKTLVGTPKFGATIPAMPSGVVVHASHSQTESAPATEVGRSSQSASAKLFGDADPSVHMLGLPKSHPQLVRWVVLAILAGSVAAFGLIAILLR